jgi:hypothetical protein
VTTWLELAAVIDKHAGTPFEEDVYYIHQAGGPEGVMPGVFDSPTDRVELAAGEPVITYQPRLHLHMPDLPGFASGRPKPVAGDTVVVRGTLYRVREVSEDDPQMRATLTLAEMPPA